MKRRMTTLGDVADSRDNHFNLIRMVAALAVLVSHAWPLTGGKGSVEPLQVATGHSLGTLAVFVFFAVSGFLVTASFARASGPAGFVVARALRIVPALAVSSWLVALGMGPLVTELPVTAYLAHPDTWAFVARNSLPVSHLFTLPGVFETNPYPHPVGSIWTLPNEVACYALVLLVGLSGALHRPVVMAAGMGAYLAWWMAVDLGAVVLPARVDALRVLSLPFVVGMAMFQWRHLVPIGGGVALGMAFASLWAVVMARHGPVYQPLLMLCLAYWAFWLAHVSAPALNGFRRIGDYSYGTYLYAFPVQGFVVWLWGPMSPLTNIALALPAVLVCAALSWHLVERPALSVRQRMTTAAYLRGTGRAGKRL